MAYRSSIGDKDSSFKKAYNKFYGKTNIQDTAKFFLNSPGAGSIHKQPPCTRLFQQPGVMVVDGQQHRVKDGVNLLSVCFQHAPAKRQLTFEQFRG